MSRVPESEPWLARSALVIALYPLLSGLAVVALGTSFAAVLLPVPDPVQTVVALAGVAVNLSAAVVLAVLTPLFLAALPYDIRGVRRRSDWHPSWWYLLALPVHGVWLYWSLQAAVRFDSPEASFLGEWYYSIVPLVVAVVLVHYLLARRVAVGVPFSLRGSGSR